LPGLFIEFKKQRATFYVFRNGASEKLLAYVWCSILETRSLTSANRVDNTVKKAASRPHFLKQLKK